MEKKTTSANTEVELTAPTKEVSPSDIGSENSLGDHFIHLNSTRFLIMFWVTFHVLDI